MINIKANGDLHLILCSGHRRTIKCLHTCCSHLLSEYPVFLGISDSTATFLVKNTMIRGTVGDISSWILGKGTRNGKMEVITLGEIVIPCLLSVCFDDAMHGIYAPYFVDTYTSCLQNRKHKSHALQQQNKPTRGMGWQPPLEYNVACKRKNMPRTTGAEIL